MPLVVPLLLALSAPVEQVIALPVRLDAKLEVPSSIVDETWLAALQSAGLKAVGRSDLDAILGAERQKDLLGCDEVACFAEIAGAFSAERIVALSIARTGGKWLINAKLIRAKGTPEVQSRLSETIAGDEPALLSTFPRLAAKLVMPGAAAGAAKCPDAPSCRESCRAKKYSDCAVAAKLTLDEGDGLTAKAMARLGCDNSDDNACAELAFTLYMTDLSNAPEARLLVQGRCRSGHAESCAVLSYVESTTTPYDVPSAWKHANESCAAGSTRGCYQLASLSESAQSGHLADRLTLRRLWLKVCDMDVTACFIASGYVDKDQVVPLIVRGCDGGDLNACMELGRRYYEGDGVPKSISRAATYFVQTCTERMASGCHGLARLYEQGIGGFAKSETKAIELYHRACRDGGMGIACLWIGEATEHGKRGFAKNVEEAKRLYELACAQGYSGGCLKMSEHAPAQRDYWRQRACGVERFAWCPTQP